MKNSTRREFLKTVMMASAASMIPFSGCGSLKRRPNILLMMVDDMGCEVPGCYGGQSYETPNLDRLAETGTRFTHCYSAAKCAPSRVKIMTGRYQFRTTEEWGYIPPQERSFGHVLGNAGYATAIAGKWQMALLKDDPHHINKMGFAESCVFGWHEGPRYHDPLIYQNGAILNDTKGKYGPELFCDFLIDFMERNRHRPFLAYYPMAVAHEISNDFWPPPSPGPDGRYQSYKELITVMDQNVGRLIKALEDLGLRENTVVLFTTDNGTPRQFLTDIRGRKYINTPIVSVRNNREVIGGKGELTDAGTRIPFIINWPGVTPAGKVCDDLIDFSDFMPTLAELAVTDLPENVVIDGHSFAHRIFGREGRPREWVYNQYEGKAWIRSKTWKLYNDGRLYDMHNDPGEINPVLESADSEVSGKMRKKLKGYAAGLNTGLLWA